MGDAVEGIGGTPLVELRRIVPEGSARVLVKEEGQNPTGSMKDRMALSVVDGAAAAGRLRPKGALVEYTGASRARPSPSCARPVASGPRW